MKKRMTKKLFCAVMSVVMNFFRFIWGVGLTFITTVMAKNASERTISSIMQNYK